MFSRAGIRSTRATRPSGPSTPLSLHITGMVCGRVDYEVFNANFYDRERRHSFTDHFAILEQLEIDLVVADRYVVGQRNFGAECSLAQERYAAGAFVK